MQMLLVVVLLYRLLGAASLAGVGALFILVPLQSKIQAYSRTFRRETLVFTDQRIRTMNEILQGIRLIKMCVLLALNSASCSAAM